jgi:hypothetical protein
MAVTIVEKGTKETPLYTRNCPECGCKFTYNYVDTQDSNWLGGFRMIKCPQCSYPVAHLTAGGGDDINHPKIAD